MISLEEPPSIFHDDWANNMTSRVFLVKTDRPSGSHVFQWTRTIIEQLTFFHEDLKIKLASKVLTRETNLPLAAIKYVLSKFQRAIFNGNQLMIIKLLPSDEVDILN
ncbi:hypothetical protein DPMN_019463 [Dreissena polymorpha]|uniref:Uncharacterized protein n=1 Tax=Dreissena polymorpha TaxID=45954 RepID=A0A9D4NL62_DREPO|nr:hypothetical protein DPMN_019463 [Dreissena polymorpha]